MPRREYAHDERRVLNPHGRRHYRRTYSLAEVRAGAAVLVALCMVAGWVVYMGAHPDPELFADPAAMLDPGKAAVSRGALPEGLAVEGFSEGRPSQFDADNLYKKINGRAPFFKSRGFLGLTFLSLGAEADPSVAVDVEFYDLGEPRNALGAYAAEAGPDATSEDAGGGLSRIERNAMYMAVDQYYVRAIGTAESEVIVRQLEQLRRVLGEALAGAGQAELPWPHRLLTERLGVAPDRVAFHSENAFSFGFAKEVYVAELPDESELFVVVAGDPGPLAERFMEGFASYGELEDGLIKDRYQGIYSVALAAEGCVIGVRGAPDAPTARAQLERLGKAVTEAGAAGGDGAAHGTETSETTEEVIDG